MYSEQYLQQVKLLLQCLPAIRNQDNFVLKGGTALNLFIRNLPRLSIDIDLTYKHLAGREASLSGIQAGLREIAAKIQKINSQFIVKEQLSRHNGYLLKLLVYYRNTLVKIEPNFVARGTLYPIVEGTLCQKINEQFNAFLDKVPMMAPSELYAGKLCAALNRQHPRDLFDIKLLFEAGGMTDAIRQAFVVYLACDARPMHELLSPNRLDITQVFHREFSRMTTIEVKLEELLDTREKMISMLNNSLTINEKEFLLSVKRGEPQFNLMPFEVLAQWPSLKWKVMNVKQMDKKKQYLMLNKLRAVLDR